MKIYLCLMAFFAISQMAIANRYNITCYYDTSSIKRGGFANFTEVDLKASLEYCTHVVYGYVGLRPNNFDIQILNSSQHNQFTQIKKLKNQYRNIKFLISLGGGKDLKNTEKYMKLLEANANTQQNFIRSAKTFLRKYHFDGLDLAYQFPLNKLKKESTFKKVIKKATKVVNQKVGAIKKSKKIDSKSQVLIYKTQFTALVNKLKNDFRRDNLMLTLTVLPHVNATKYLDIPTIVGDLDFVNLGTFDYSTPERTPREADYLAPLNSPPSQKKHLSKSNIESDVRQWLSYRIPAGKLNIGIPTYGRAWRMSKALKSTVMPVTSSLAGPAQAGELTRIPGLLSWTEICFRITKMSKTNDRTYGNYAYRSANVKGQDGLFITYEDQDSLEAKARFVQKNSLGGVAIFDLTLDDFRGKCNAGRFPALKTIKYKLY